MEQYGKPTEATYKFEEGVLKERILTLTGEKVDTLPNVYVSSSAFLFLIFAYSLDGVR